jgi:1,2-phenylacetyl-CoA epoxidase PaaB subunit
MTMYDVFRAKNAEDQTAEHLGQVEATDEASALAEAAALFDCRPTHHLYVWLADDASTEGGAA